MVVTHKLSSLLLFAFLIFIGKLSIISATVFTLQNKCSYPVWPATLSDNVPPIFAFGGFELLPEQTFEFPAPPGWSGRLWARTGCFFNFDKTVVCGTGDCGGQMNCTVGGTAPVNVVEFRLADGIANMDFYNVSLVDGYNGGIGVRPSGGSGDCRYAGCVQDLNARCPTELQFVDSRMGLVACKSPCTAFNAPAFCCTGENATPLTCSPTVYSKIFKEACPVAYSYAFDDISNTCSCTGADYLISFCPTS